MTEQSTLLTLLLVRPDIDCSRTTVVGRLWMWTAFLRTDVDAKIPASAHLCKWHLSI